MLQMFNQRKFYKSSFYTLFYIGYFDNMPNDNLVLGGQMWKTGRKGGVEETQEEGGNMYTNG